MTFYRPPKPDVFEVLMLARTHVFARSSADSYVIVAVIRHGISLTWFCDGDREPERFEYLQQTAEELGLFDGAAWNLPALATWLENLSSDNSEGE